MSLSSNLFKPLSRAQRSGAHALLILSLMGGCLAFAQTDAGQQPSNDSIKQLMDRLAAAEAKIKQLETNSPTPSAPAPPQ